MHEEIWKQVPQYPNYEVSDKGRVRSNHRKTPRILILGINQSGYPRALLSGKKFYVHTLVLEAFMCPRPEGYEANHKDCVKSHNWVENLEWVTHHENMSHAKINGRFLEGKQRGSLNSSAKLTESQVLHIKKLNPKLGSSETAKIAARYSVTRDHIRSILNGKRWKHIQAGFFDNR